MFFKMYVNIMMKMANVNVFIYLFSLKYFPANAAQLYNAQAQNTNRQHSTLCPSPRLLPCLLWLVLQ